MSLIYPIILAGGIGTRLWPLSRTQCPKQFLRIDGPSLFQQTYERAVKLSDKSHVIVVTNEIHRFLVYGQIEELGYPVYEENVLVEQIGRNTLPAISWAAERIKLRDPNGCIAVFPSDHRLGQSAPEEIAKALPLAQEHLVTFGILPSSPHTGYGYIAPGEECPPGYLVKEFKEKPDSVTAMHYVKQGYLWNSGMFLFSAKIFEEELKKYQPEIFRLCQNVIPDYEIMPSISIDYGLLEKSDVVAVVPLNADWTDLGNFVAWYDISEKDANGNAGDFYKIDAARNYVSAGKRVTALLGVNDTIVVDTDDALLVCRKDMAEQVGSLVKTLKSEGNPITEIHRQVFRPWGSYIELETGSSYKIKRINVNPEKRLSLQKHRHRSEHWVVIHGSADVILGDKQIFLRPGESTFVPAGMIHRLSNPGKIPLEVIEVQIGEYLNEDDIERIEDDFERV